MAVSILAHPVSAGIATNGRDVLDARPVIERSATSIWSRVERVRDDLYEAFVVTATREGIEPLLLKSDPFVYPTWVKFTAWLPRPGHTVTERVGAVVTIEPKPYHRFEFEYHLEWYYRGHTKHVRRLRAFTPRQVTDLVRSLLAHGPEPKFGSIRLRDEPDAAFWRPINKVVVVRPDRARLIPVVLFTVGVALLSSALILPGLLLVGAGLIVARELQRRVPLVRLEGKPLGEPRYLSAVDSWQTVVFGLGREQSKVRERFLHTLKAAPSGRFSHHAERVWYWGLDGKEEREQIVLASGRGLVFCQIYAYGADLYVGWNGDVNRGQWVEQTIAKGVEKDTGQVVTLNSVVVGTQQITEYDIIDLSCLMEWAHAQLVKLLKDLIQEHHIDQEIDFKILRGQRQGLVTSGAVGGQGTAAAGKLRRTA